MRIEADVVERGGRVWLEKTCQEHGRFRVLLMSDKGHYYEAPVGVGSLGACCGPACGVPAAEETASAAENPWTNHSCTVLIEICERCNLSCPTCFAGSSPQHSKTMGLDTFRARLDVLIQGGKQAADTIQLSGGEPTTHPELFEMIDILFARGFSKVTINSNGIKLAQTAFVKQLAARKRRHPGARLFVYLQFDGFDDETYMKLRGRADLLEIKRRALLNCIEAGISVHPVMTLTRDINEHEVGDFLTLAVDHPAVKHVVIQPAMYSGRYDNPRRADRLTLADTINLVCEQFEAFAPEDFGPIPCSHPNCHSVAVALRTGARLVPVSRYFPRHADWGSDDARELVAAFTNSIDGPSGFSEAIRWATSDKRLPMVLESLDDDEVEALLEALIALQSDRGNAWDRLLTVSIKPFMDAWTYDQDRIDRCCVHILDDDGNPVSFCEFNAIHRPRMLTQGENNA
jgi:uncharacterized radical SAM superfamily Fe-S cluster-containing enzyme